MPSDSYGRDGTVATPRPTRLRPCARHLWTTRSTCALILRLERTLIALALTFDAQAATRQQLNGQEREDNHLNDSVADLQTAAEQYRHLARTLPNGNPSR